MNQGNRRAAAAGPRRDGAEPIAPHGSGRANAGDTRSAASRVLTVARNVLAAGSGHRPVDVICAGMYRACSTWQYEVVAHLVEHHRGGRRAGYLTAEEYVGPRGRKPADPKPTGAEAGGWRVLKSHDGDPCFARAIAQGQAVAIYAYRDVRDVVFSLMHKRRLTFEQLLRQGMIHQVLANDRFWTCQPNVLIQRYDDIMTDPVGAIRGLAQHLGIKPASGEVERIAEEYSLAANKARTDALKRQLEKGGVDLDAATNSLICDSATLLHWNHVRDGKSGSWFAESTPRQRHILQRLCGSWLRARGYPPVPDGAGSDEIASRAIPVGDRLRIEFEIGRGRLCYLARAASQRFPRLAVLARRILGLAGPSQSGATVWSDSKGGSS